MALEIIEKAITPSGVKMQLEKWDDGMMIGAYPIAQRGDSCWVRGGETFRLSIASNKYKNYSNEQVREDFEALKNGDKTLMDLAEYFWNGDKDKYRLGIE